MNNLKELIEEIKKNILFNFDQIDIDDLMDDRANKLNFKQSYQKLFLKEKKSDDEDTKYLKHLECFKRDMFINFTNPEIGLEIINLCENYGIL